MQDTPQSGEPLDEPGLGLLGGGAREAAGAYRVLARKYRPRNFNELIGQEALVRTLSNAMTAGRLAHAFILSGVRGVGKTTTARILARCLNYQSKDGEQGINFNPVEDGVHCAAIAESRHVDVLEMDAASRTGIDDIREIIEGVRYMPASARYKIYIIDEVHMLSKAAFNGLLKTLEEPPPHVIFIFATTEIRKVPVTVLSRCQRFDLRRVSIAGLTAHLDRIAKLESANVSPGALTLMARAAEGSVRDALSLLDQAIAHGAGEVSEDQVRDMLGLADRSRVFDLFEAVMRGDMPAALRELRAQYDTGADPVVILQDMLDIVHWLTRIKVAPDAAFDASLPESERQAGTAMAAGLSVPALSRAWQFLLKGLNETRESQHTLASAEMALVRLAHAGDMPTPADIIRRLETKTPAHAPTPRSPVAAPTASVMRSHSQAQPAPQSERHEPVAVVSPQPQANLPQSFTDVVALAELRRDIKLKTALEQHVHLVSFEAGRIEFRPTANANPQLAAHLSERLMQWTGTRWMVSVSNAPGEPTLDEARAAATAARFEMARQLPLVQAALQIFPDAEIVDVREIGDAQ